MPLASIVSVLSSRILREIRSAQVAKFWFNNCLRLFWFRVYNSVLFALLMRTHNISFCLYSLYVSFVYMYRLEFIICLVIENT